LKERGNAMLSKRLDKLPPHIKREALDYIEFLVKKYLRPRQERLGSSSEKGAFRT
jgi:hypothetical protein